MLYFIRTNQQDMAISDTRLQAINEVSDMYMYDLHLYPSGKVLWYDRDIDSVHLWELSDAINELYEILKLRFLEMVEDLNNHTEELSVIAKYARLMEQLKY